jgi:hypothetical protein
MEYIVEANEKGRMAPRKVGVAPIMRDGIEYEFTIVFEVLENHKSYVSKDRTGMFINEGNFLITEDTGRKIANWLASAKDAPLPVVPETPPTSEPSSQPETPTAPPLTPTSPEDNLMWKGSIEDMPAEFDRAVEIENVKRLVREGYFTKEDIAEALKHYGAANISSLTEGAFESFVVGHIRLVEQIVDETTKRNIPRAKLNELARLDNEHSFFVSTIATKKKILAVILELTIPQQGNA